MKKLPLFMLLAAGCFAVACDNDDDSGNNNSNADLVGTYNMTSFSGPTAVDFNGDGITSTNFMTESQCYNNSSMTINADGTYTSRSNSMSILNGASSCGSTVTTNGKWTRNGNTIQTTQTSSGTGAGVARNWAFSESSNTLTNAETNGQYPSFNASTNQWVMSSGNTSTIYTGQN